MAAYFFNAEEIFHVAIHIEQNGEAFYNLMLKSVSDAKAKQVCIRLAKEEHCHKLIFENLLSALVQQKGSMYNLTEFPEDDLSYLKALADSNVFGGTLDINQLSPQMKTAKEAIKVALDFEKASILFFIQMKQFTRPEWGQKEINQLIAQEQEHIKALTALMKEV